MKDKPSLNKNITQHHCAYSTEPSNKIFVRILFALIAATLFI